MCKSDLNGLKELDFVAQDQPATRQETPKIEKPPTRLDRFGTEIIPRSHRLKLGLKSAHKVTYIDSVHKENHQHT